MGKHHIPAAIISAAAALACLCSCSRDSMYRDYEISNYYLLTFDNRSSRDIVWFVPYHGNVTCDKAGALPETLAGTDFCRFETKARMNLDVRVSSDKSGPFESYHKDDKVPVYVFDAEVFNSEKWQDIVSGDKYLALYHLSAKDVVDSKKKVTYIGD